MQNFTDELTLTLNRRAFLRRNTAGIGMAALTSLLQESQASEKPSTPTGGLHFPAKAKRIIYLSQSGAPSQLDLFDYKPGLKKFHKTELPDSILQKLPTISASSNPCILKPSITILRSLFCRPAASRPAAPVWAAGSLTAWVAKTRIFPHS